MKAKTKRKKHSSTFKAKVGMTVLHRQKSGECVGKTKPSKGTKWMVVVDGHGVPLGSQMVSANPGGSDAGRIHAGTNLRAAWRPRLAAQTSAASALAPARHVADLFASEKPPQAHRSTTAAPCAAIASAGRSNAPLPGRAIPVCFWCATSIRTECAKPFLILPASSSLSGTYETISRVSGASPRPQRQPQCGTAARFRLNFPLI